MSHTWSTGVTKLDKVKFGATRSEAETIRKMIVAMSRDPRVLVIKLAGPAAQHAHAALPATCQAGAKKALETLEVLAPLAHRLGMNDRQVGAGGSRRSPSLYPKRYDEIVRLVAEPGAVARHVPADQVDRRRSQARSTRRRIPV